VEFGKPGKMILGIRPVKDGWQPINLRSAKLKPVK